jgi:hypothetical protein
MGRFWEVKVAQRRHVRGDQVFWHGFRVKREKGGVCGGDEEKVLYLIWTIMEKIFGGI